MKQGKKLTREQKEFLSKRGYNCKEFVYHTENEQAVCFIRKANNETVWVERRKHGK